ncbi:START domain-containing protein 10 [Eumeta japonica]|uniref:START domain-containing protein 10 n=1 Tax=Eumeta variegata TaxID=151549 RepID=A0A4C1SBI0_EUMVA|nr:START domain-containing protein 10 [Eumeta japonica]
MGFMRFFFCQVVAPFEDVSADTLYDVLHDPEYRSVWDTHMLAAEDAGHINVNNDVGYYASSLDDLCKTRSRRDTNKEGDGDDNFVGLY